MMLTPGGERDNEICTSQRLKVRHGRVVFDDKLSVYAFLYQYQVQGDGKNGPLNSVRNFN